MGAVENVARVVSLPQDAMAIHDTHGISISLADNKKVVLASPHSQRFEHLDIRLETFTSLLYVLRSEPFC